MGEAPDDYALFKAAQFCNAKPWELAEQALWWKIKALDYMSAEAEAEQIIADRKK